jgi:integrase
MGRRRAAGLRFHFTKAALERLVPPASGRDEHHDTGQPGLTLRVSPSGAKVFYVYKRVGGRPERLRIGAFPELDVPAARKAALARLGEIALGRNPAAERRARAERGTAATPKTLADLWELYLQRHSKPRLKSSAANEWRWRKHLGPELGNRRLASLHRGDVEDFVVRIKETSGPAEANNCGVLLRSMLGKAVEWELLTANPARGVTRFRIAPRERVLQREELARLFAALASESDENLRDFVVLALFTGQRKGNLLAARWDQIDLEAALWTLPAASMKGGRSHRVPLVGPALAVLERRWAHAAAGAVYVFPGRAAGTHRTRMDRDLAALFARAGVAGVRTHDLRRTLASWLASAGVSLGLIQRTLAHSDVGTTVAHYAMLDTDPVRRAMQQAADAMMAAGDDAPTVPALPAGEGGGT